MPKYKHGKQKEIIPFNEIVELVKKAKLKLEGEGFFWILYYCGVRKSEAYERVKEDFKITSEHCIIDFHQRKKGGETVPPLEIPLHWAGVDKIVNLVKLASRRKKRRKVIYRYLPTGKTKVTKAGNVRPITKRTGISKMGKWVFPHIQHDRAWKIAKRVLGEKHYPHFLRLNRLTEIGSDPSASLTRLKSFSGIKSTRVLDEYLGTSRKEQKKALDFIEKKMQKTED